eukprot:12890303-Ditylum_brightwellii.AAC.1
MVGSKTGVGELTRSDSRSRLMVLSLPSTSVTAGSSVSPAGGTRLLSSVSVSGHTRDLARTWLLSVSIQ